MSDESIAEFYEALGFEEIEIEDNLSALSFELDQQGNYALITTEEGLMPETLKQSIIFACYSPEGSFQWSAGFKNSYVFKEIWSKSEDPQEKLDAIQKSRGNDD